MAEYTLTLQNTSDYRMIKKLLKAFDGASITPVRRCKGTLERSIEDARKGNVQGPFSSVEQLMAELLD